jgi:hypothetical protein
MKRLVLRQLMMRVTKERIIRFVYCFLVVYHPISGLLVGSCACVRFFSLDIFLLEQLLC